MGRNNKLRLLSFSDTQEASNHTLYSIGGREASAGQVGAQMGALCGDESAGLAEEKGTGTDT